MMGRWSDPNDRDFDHYHEKEEYEKMRDRAREGEYIVNNHPWIRRFVKRLNEHIYELQHRVGQLRESNRDLCEENEKLKKQLKKYEEDPKNRGTKIGADLNLV